MRPWTAVPRKHPGRLLVFLRWLALALLFRADQSSPVQLSPEPGARGDRGGLERNVACLWLVACTLPRHSTVVVTAISFGIIWHDQCIYIHT
jgi:hypothetical protein